MLWDKDEYRFGAVLWCYVTELKEIDKAFDSMLSVSFFFLPLANFTLFVPYVNIRICLRLHIKIRKIKIKLEVCTGPAEWFKFL